MALAVAAASRLPLRFYDRVLADWRARPMTHETDRESCRTLVETADRMFNPAGVVLIDGFIRQNDLEGARDYMLTKLDFMWDAEDIDEETYTKFFEALNSIKDRPDEERPPG
jgi:hypothetical protein